MRTATFCSVLAAVCALTACDRFVAPTRPTPATSSSPRPLPQAAFGTVTNPFPLVDWDCVATASGRGATCFAAEPSAAASRSVHAAADATTPGAPAQLVNVTQGGRVSLRWLAPSSGDPPTSYVVEAGSGSGRADIASIDTGSAAPGLDLANVATGTYFVRVRAKNAAGISGPSNELTIVVNNGPCVGAPNAPAGLAFTISGSNVLLTWSPPSGGCPPTAFLLEVGSATGLTNLGIFNTGSVSTSLAAKGLDPGRYFVRLRATTTSGSSAPSNEVVVTIAALPLTSTSFVAYGDSLTAGESGLESLTATDSPVTISRFRPTVLLPLAQRYPTVLQQDLVNRYRTQTPMVTNAGQPGEAVADSGTFTRFLSYISSGQYGVVLILEGTNDLFGHSITSVAPAVTGLQQMVRAAKSRGVRPYLATIPPINPQGFRGSTYSSNLVAPLNDGIRALAVGEGVTLVDVNQAFNGNLGLLGIDGLHPNATGYATIAETFFAAIKSTLEASSSAIEPASRIVLRR